MNHKEFRYSLMVLLGAILWGTIGTAQHFAPEGATPISIGAVRLAIGGGAIMLYAFLKGKLNGKEILFKRSTYIGAASMASFQLTFFAAVLMTGVAMGTVVAIGSAPIFAGLISLIVNKESPGIKWLVSTLVSVLGCILLVTGGGDLSVNMNGILIALGAGASYAVYTASTKNLLDIYSPEMVTGVVFTMGAIILSPFLLIYSLDWLKTAQGLGVALHLGLVTTAFAYVLFSYGLSGIKLHKAVTLTLAEPVTAAILGVFLLKEQLSMISGFGMGLVFAGLVILSITRPVRNKESLT
ncbi:EamA family transporter [Gudongella sp. DL1XJH-153]|uniref:EamA family transporter n=1 Tax=Gudongella sp. DL1XJH-153 TaxID=3409804 RepID=UPI003BB571B3